MKDRFVILAHSGQGPLHYDLMLEAGPALATWQLLVPPDEWREDEALAARKLPDHRREYLSYEGEISRGRGQVKRIDAGMYNILSADEDLWDVEIAGSAVRGRFELRHMGPAAEAWELRKARAESD